MDINDSLDLIIEVLNNRAENRIYQMYLASLTIQSLNGKIENYSDYKSKRLDKSKKANSTKLTEEEKKKIIDRNNSILRKVKVGD